VVQAAIYKGGIGLGAWPVLPQQRHGHPGDDGEIASLALRMTLRFAGSTILILSMGQITRYFVQPLSQKYFASLPTQITCVFEVIPCPRRGAFRDRHGRWCGMRWTWWLRLTSVADADGEVVWS
jgi:hypothetical protein